MTEPIPQVAEVHAILPGVVAVVGCDGTGKSTLSADLLARLRARGPAQRFYLGLVSGEVGDKIKSLPLVGPRLERYLAGKASRAQDMRQQIPGHATAIVMYLMSLWRLHRFRRMLALASQGVVVITDRFPQAEVPGFHYDGPGLWAARGQSRLMGWLATRELRVYRWMVAHLPALVIRLNIDVETARARKPDHDQAELSDKIAVAPRLTFHGAHIVDIDAREPYVQVRDSALRAIGESLGGGPDRSGGLASRPAKDAAHGIDGDAPASRITWGRP